MDSPISKMFQNFSRDINLFSVNEKKIERNKEDKLKTHNYCADREMQWELWFASTPMAICASVFPNGFLYLLALTKPLRTLLGHLKTHVDISFAGVACNSIVTKSLS